MKLVNRNIVANLLGQSGTALINIIATPFFFAIYGADRYGVVLLFMSILTLSSFMDMGLGSSFIRLIAMSRAEPEKMPQTNRLMSWSIVYYFAASILSGVILILVADYILSSWATIPKTIYADAKLGLVIWAVAIMVRWPITFTGGLINGLERHATLNHISFFGTLGRTLVSLAVAHFVTLDIYAFALIYLLSSVGELAVTLYAAFARSPLRIEFARPERDAVRTMLLFSTGIAVSSLTAWFIKTADKFIISGNVPIAEFSVYQTTFTLLSGFTLIAAAVTRAFYPHMSAVANQPLQLAAAFHRATRLIVSVTIPAACALMLNSELVLSLWVRSAELGARWAHLFGVVCLAMAINSIMQVPQFLAWAGGRSKATAGSNVIAVVFVVPVMLYLTHTYGAMGGAMTWLLYNMAYFIIFPIFAYREAIGAGISRWYGEVLARSAIAIIFVSVPVALVGTDHPWLRLAAAVFGVAAFWAALLGVAQTRRRPALAAG